MATTLDWDSLYKVARQNIRPRYRKLRRMDADDWLAKVGLERRNVAVDVASALGFALLGCTIGFGIGMLMAPKPGNELRKDLNRKVRDTAERTAERMGIKEQSPYAS